MTLATDRACVLLSPPSSQSRPVTVPVKYGGKTMGNTVTVVGNLTRDPELRYMTNSKGVASFGVAVNRRYQVNGEWTEQVSFFNVVCYGDLGENVAASCKKGDRLIVTGRLDQRSWDDKATGDKRSIVEIVADECGPSLRWATSETTRVTRETVAVPA